MNYADQLKAYDLLEKRGIQVGDFIRTKDGSMRPEKDGNRWCFLVLINIEMHPKCGAYFSMEPGEFDLQTIYLPDNRVRASVRITKISKNYMWGT